MHVYYTCMYRTRSHGLYIVDWKARTVLQRYMQNMTDCTSVSFSPQIEPGDVKNYDGNGLF